MRRALLLALGAAFVAASSCRQDVELERTLSSFEVRLLSPVGSPEHRCILPGTPTTGVDLTGCPSYERDAAGATVARVEFEARAIDNRGDLLDTFDGFANVSVVPGRVESAFRLVRFEKGIAGGSVRRQVSFRGAFGDTFVWLTDGRPPDHSSDIAGLGVACGQDNTGVCDGVGLTCVNSKPTTSFDPEGLAYCTLGCDPDLTCEDTTAAGCCPSGWFCGTKYTPYGAGGADVSSGACLRTQPSYAAGVGGPIHLVEPTIADVNRSTSLISTPFQDDFIEIHRGKMVVTAVRIDGFYVTDLCPILGRAGQMDDRCTAHDLSVPEGFNHLFVFNFSRPDDLFPGDQLTFVSGPMSEFNGFTEMNFPLWEVDFAAGPQELPAAIDLHDRIIDHFPDTLEPGGRCFQLNRKPEDAILLDCSFAMERIEAARVKAKVLRVEPVVAGSPEAMNYDRFGQWPVTLDTKAGDLVFQIITRENLPFFDPLPLGGMTINQEITGNLRQVAFDDRSEPIWIIEPSNQADCSWCLQHAP